MADMVAFKVERPQVLAATDATRDASQFVVGQADALDMVVFGEVDFADAAVVEKMWVRLSDENSDLSTFGVSLPEKLIIHTLLYLKTLGRESK